MSSDKAKGIAAVEQVEKQCARLIALAEDDGILPEVFHRALERTA